MFSFVLPDSFVAQYRNIPEPFGFGALGAVTFYRTYARIKSDGSLESWADACERVINGMYSIQKDYCKNYGRPWSDSKALESAKEAFHRMFYLKWSPPGRGISHMGSPSVMERGMIEALQNCSFISTKQIATERGSIYAWIMEMLMLGVGVGFDTLGAGKAIIIKPSKTLSKIYVIPDTREGWAESTELLINSYIHHPQQLTATENWVFDYSKIRKKGEIIHGFGGYASGPEPLMEMHEKIRMMFEARPDGDRITSRDITDIANMIGCVVVAGNVRRSSEIALGLPSDNDFKNLKNYEMYPERAAHGWASNNSILANVGMDYSEYISPIMDNGEPGFVWLENIRKYARMNGVPDHRDLADGVNPCGEQPLRGWSPAGVGGEMCTLVELYPYRHTSVYDISRSIKFAYLYGKTVTLLSEMIKHDGTRDIMMDNRRIGLSMTGIAQYTTNHGAGGLVKMLSENYDFVRHYDKRYSSWFGIPESVRVTSVKPSGTVSLVAGATPGVHYPHSEFYIRRIRMSDDSYLAPRLIAAGVHVEPDKYSRNTLVASFPIHAGIGIRSAKSLSIWEQLEMAAIMQRHWSDNAVSVTVSVNPSKTTNEELAAAISMYQNSLKTVSFLPEIEGGAYEQMPYEEITREAYSAMQSGINYSALSSLNQIIDDTSRMSDKYCDGAACEIVPKSQ